MSVQGLPTYEYFNVTVPAEYVAYVEINRPKKLNAFCNAMWYEMKDIFTRLSSHPDIRAILLCSAGEGLQYVNLFSLVPDQPPRVSLDYNTLREPAVARKIRNPYQRAFTAGLDVQQASEGGAISGKGFGDPARKAFSIRRHVLELQDCVTTLADCEKPVIALLHGISYGLGIDLATACDIRLCASNTRFCIKEVDIGLAADVGTLSRIPKVVGGLTSWLKEVCMTAREFTAEEAVHNRFVSKSVQGGKEQLIQEGIKLAKLLATKSPVAVQGTKNILDAAWGRTVADNLNYTAIWNSGMVQCSDTERAMLSSLQKRVPTFEKL